MKLCIALFLLVIALPCQPQTQGRIDADLAKDLTDTEEIVGTLARCNGYWMWMAEAADQLGRPSASAYLKTYANGAQTTALWILSARYQVEHPSEPPRNLGSFSNLIAGPSEIERLRMAALWEANDSEALDAMGAMCRETAAAIDPLLQSIRKDLLDPSEAQPPKQHDGSQETK